LIYRRGLLWTVLLLLANGLLLVGIIQVWWGEEALPTAAGPRAGLEVPRPPVLRDQQPLNAYRVVSAKNLFSQDRSGPDPAQPSGKAQATLEGRKLLGVIIIGEERAALIGGQPPGGSTRAPTPQAQAAAQVEVVRQGEDWGGFQVVEISSEAVVFQGKDGKKTLNFPD
jgi:hypothetical protein